VQQGGSDIPIERQSGETSVRLRVDRTLPTQYGEKVVMRLLEPDTPLQEFGMLGFPPAISDALKKMFGPAAGNDSSDRPHRFGEAPRCMRRRTTSASQPSTSLPSKIPWNPLRARSQAIYSNIATRR